VHYTKTLSDLSANRNPETSTTVQNKGTQDLRSVLPTKHYSRDQIKDRACSTIWERSVAYGLLVRKPEGKRPLGRPRHGWEDNIEIYPQEVDECHEMD
jgi:hypothetical protein